MKPIDRRAGYWNRERETMSAGARERYQAAWLAALLEHAWTNAPGVRRRLEQAGLSAKSVRSTDDLARLPVIKKSAMPDLQKADPPFGGFCTVPLAKIRKIFVSPGPIFEPMGPGETKIDRKSTRLNSSHVAISYAVFCLKKKMKTSFNSI